MAKKLLRIGSLVEALYRGNSGVIFRVTAIEGEVCQLVPHLSPTGEPVTKKHGYQERRLHSAWLRPWTPKPSPPPTPPEAS